MPEAVYVDESVLTGEDIDALDPETRAALERDVMRYVASTEDSPRGFACFFRLMHGTPLHSEGERWIANAYRAHGLGRGLAQECHRESGKTTVFSKFFMAFRMGHEPHKINAVIRINDEKASETTAAVARIIETDEMWKLIFPHVVPDKTRGWGERGYFVRRTDISDAEWNRLITPNPDGPSLVGYGWKSGSITGSRFNGLVVVDDIHDEENTSSERQLRDVKKWYTDTFKFCVMRGAWEIWNFTPWVEKDLYAYIKATGEYLHSRSPVMRPAKEGDPGASYWEPTPLHPDMPEAGNIPISGRWWKLYWPEQWDFDRIASYYRTSGMLGFARMMFLDLEATRGLNLKADWLHEYPGDQIGTSWPVYVGIDYATTVDKLRGKERDFFSMSFYRGIPGGGLVLFDGYKGKISKGEALQRVQAIAGIYPTIQLIAVETHGKGEELYNDMVLLNDVYGKPLPLLSIQHGKKSKGDRFEGWLAPRFQMARIWISDTPTPWLTSFREQWLTWPNCENDDDLDAAYMGAVAGEGALPSFAETAARSGYTRKENPYKGFATG